MTTFLPIVGRELRVASRRRGTFWLRSGVVLAVLIAAVWIILAAQEESPHEMGMILFYVLTGAAQLYCLTAGLRFTADCLSEEKRDGTLGLLFLTDLKGYDIVGGKLVANSMNALYALLAVVPVMGLPLLMGGVAPAEFGRMALVLVNTLFFSLAVGMFASSVTKTARGAVGWALVWLLIFTAGIPLLGAWVSWGMTKWVTYRWEFLLTSPVFTYATAVDEVYTRLGVRGFFWSLGIIHALGWVFLLLASLITPRSWQETGSRSRTMCLRERIRSWLEGGSEAGAAFRARTLDRSAFYWLSTRPRLRPLGVWTLFVFVGLLWLWGAVKFKGDWLSEPVYVLTALTLNSVLKCWIAGETGRQLIEDRRIGSMELLLSTPLTVGSIVHGQKLALVRQFGMPVVVLLCGELIMLFHSLNAFHLGNDRTWWFWMWILGMVMLLMDIVALFWVNLWLAMSSRNPKFALGGAVIRILFLPWIAFAVVMTFFALLPYEVRRDLFKWDGWPVVLWFGLGLVADVFFGLIARSRLLSEFRELAAQRYQPRPSLWQRMFGR